MNKRLQDQLPAMFALAHERSDAARVHLAGMLADLFLASDNSLNNREEQLVNELIDQLLQNPSPTVRRMLVEKFADSVRMPRRMAMTLACDEIETARAILLTNTMFTDSDLITIVETQSRDHSKAIASRAKITEAVADALVVTGDVEIMRMVAQNLGAKLSPRAIDIMIEAARFTEDLHEPLVHRPEMTMDAAIKLYWWVSQDLRRYMLKRFGIGAGQVDEALSRMIESVLGKHDRERNNDQTMGQVADFLIRCGAAVPRTFPQILRLGHFRLFYILLSRMTNLDPSVIDLVVTGAGGRALAVACRSLDIDKPTFVSIFLLSRAARSGDQIVHPRELSHAIGAFDRLTVKLARDLLANWRKDPSYLKQKNYELSFEE